MILTTSDINILSLSLRGGVIRGVLGEVLGGILGGGLGGVLGKPSFLHLA